ncbi:MAG: NAD(P)/FAD-dependent oxidoreductase [Deltaproteobacteria bacterium]|nr:NAD(P)/FAD-dependent oxidoreductase [Deltaproteobacteria bacterium]
MPDKTFDAVIIGGGNKSLFLAMYLMKYGGMSVGVFERRHEIGGCLATEEIAAPGFRGNTHANIIMPVYYAPIYRDFPEFWDYGAQWEQYLCSDGAAFANNDTCLAIYSIKHDPTQERTAEEIERFSQKDAENWLKLWRTFQSDEIYRVMIDQFFYPQEQTLAPEFGERQMGVFEKLMEGDLVPDSLTLKSSPLRQIREMWESRELQYCHARFVVSAATDVNDPGMGMETVALGAQLPILGFNRGGTHMIAHAAHQILNQMGCSFHINKEVKNVIIENGTAKGIRLTDGSQIGARKLVVSAGLSPEQVAFDMIGREHFSDKVARRVELLSCKHIACLMWCSFALHEPPKYKAEGFNPDIHETFWLGLGTDADPERIANECRWHNLGKFPPLEDFSPVVCCNSLVDPSFAPPGKHVAQNEMQAPPASAHTEKEWLEIKKRYIEDMMTFWQKYAPNMTSDNLIGVDSNSPYDNLRMKNLAPHGNAGMLDRSGFQLGENRPIPELANHRTPIKNLYATGTAWHPGGNGGAGESYNCYKIIAAEMGLDNPWQKLGSEETESLVAEVRNVVKRTQGSLEVNSTSE